MPAQLTYNIGTYDDADFSASNDKSHFMQQLRCGSAFLTFKVPKTRFNTVIIRLAGEMGIKAAWTRKMYERRLITNIKATLRHYTISYDALNRRFGRLYLQTSQAKDVCQRLTKVFGISSLSPAFQTTSNLDDIVNGSVFLARRRLRRGSSFAVRCKRIGRHAYSSTEVCREVGRRMLDAFPDLQLRVDLKSPDVTIGIEVREDQAFVFAEVTEAVGGLPLGTQPKVVCLLEESVNSYAACWLVMKRGCPIVSLYFDNKPFSDEDTTKLMLEVARTLFDWAIGFPRKVYVVPHGQNLAEIRRKCPEDDLSHVISRRLIYRVAERMAETKRAEGIVSGESLGEPPVKTLASIRLLDETVKLYPIHRPVIGLTDAEVAQLAKKIGIRATLLKKMRRREKVQRKAVRTITLSDVEIIEKELDIDKMVDASIESLRIVNLKG